MMKFFKNTVIALASVVVLTAFVADDKELKPANKQVDWSFNGFSGQIDNKSAQRGFQVYREVCAACHSLDYFTFRTLDKIGYGEEQIKAIAAEYEVPGELDDFGDETVRSGLPQDAMPSPYANELAARASNNGAYPPDLSLLVKARPDGANYLYSLLTGYGDAPADVEMDDGMHFNPYFAGDMIAMAEPFSDDRVEYMDGTPATQDQIAKDITMFLMYVAEPSLDDRKMMGFNVLSFLVLLTLVFYLSMKKIWAPVKRGENIIDG